MCIEIVLVSTKRKRNTPKRKESHYCKENFLGGLGNSTDLKHCNSCILLPLFVSFQYSCTYSWSPDLWKALAEICTWLSVKLTPHDAYMLWRWLSCFDDTLSTVQLMDARTLFSFLTLADARLYKTVMDAIMERILGTEVQRKFKRNSGKIVRKTYDGRWKCKIEKDLWKRHM